MVEEKIPLFYLVVMPDGDEPYHLYFRPNHQFIGSYQEEDLKHEIEGCGELPLLDFLKAIINYSMVTLPRLDYDRIKLTDGEKIREEYYIKAYKDKTERICAELDIDMPMVTFKRIKDAVAQYNKEKRDAQDWSMESFKEEESTPKPRKVRKVRKNTTATVGKKVIKVRHNIFV